MATVLDILSRFPTVGATVRFDADTAFTLSEFITMLRAGDGDNHAAVVMPATQDLSCRTWFIFESNDTGILSGTAAGTLHYDRGAPDTMPNDG